MSSFVLVLGAMRAPLAHSLRFFAFVVVADHKKVEKNGSLPSTTLTTLPHSLTTLGAGRVAAGGKRSAGWWNSCLAHSLPRSASGVLKSENEVGGDEDEEDAPLSVCRSPEMPRGRVHRG